MGSPQVNATPAMGAEPLTCFAIPRARRRHEPPVRRRVIEPLEVHELMNDHVVAHPVGHGDEPPVEADVTVPPAGTPARALIADADARDAQAVLIGELPQPNRELRSRLRAEPLSIVEGETPVRQRRALTQHPVEMASREGIGLPPRAPRGMVTRTRPSCSTRSRYRRARRWRTK